MPDARRLGIGRATIFRTLDVLVDLQAVERLDLPTGDHAYVACEPAHHHHVVCSNCGREPRHRRRRLASRRPRHRASDRLPDRRPPARAVRASARTAGGLARFHMTEARPTTETGYQFEAVPRRAGVDRPVSSRRASPGIVSRLRPPTRCASSRRRRCSPTSSAPSAATHVDGRLDHPGRGRARGLRAASPRTLASSPRPSSSCRTASVSTTSSTGIIEPAGSATAERARPRRRDPDRSRSTARRTPTSGSTRRSSSSYYLPAIRDSLARLDPAARRDIEASATAYAASLRALDASNSDEDRPTIPAEHRKLVTFHDAFPYFAAHYGFELVGVILENPGQEPSAADLAALVRRSRRPASRRCSPRRSSTRSSRRRSPTKRASPRSSRPCTTTPSGRPRPTPTSGSMTWDVDEIVKALK